MTFIARNDVSKRYDPVNGSRPDHTASMLVPVQSARISPNYAVSHAAVKPFD